VASDPQAVLEAADELRVLGTGRKEARDRPSVLGDQDALGVHSIEDRKALGLELGSGNALHAESLEEVIISVQLSYPSRPSHRST
jgi:hypothetical protein